MARKYNPLTGRVDPNDSGIIRTPDGEVYVDGVRMGASYGSSEDMSDSGIASGITLKAQLEMDRKHQEAQLAEHREKVRHGYANVADIVETILIHKRNPSIEDVLDYNLKN